MSITIPLYKDNATIISVDVNFLQCVKILLCNLIIEEVGKMIETVWRRGSLASAAYSWVLNSNKHACIDVIYAINPYICSQLTYEKLYTIYIYN